MNSDNESLSSLGWRNVRGVSRVRLIVAAGALAAVALAMGGVVGGSATASSDASSSAATGPVEQPVRPQETFRTIVIDPGHGGEEVGARGPGGTLEKDVVLAIARRLRDQLVNALWRIGLTAR